MSRILIVDDEPAVLAVIGTILRRERFSDLRETLDPRKAVELFREFRPDLVLLDLQMPGLDGFGVMEQLRPHIAPDDYLPILVLTGDISAEAKRRALSSGASDFVNKPFDTVELLLRIRNLLEMRAMHLRLREQNAHLEQRVRERTGELQTALDAEQAAGRAKTAFLSVLSHELRTPLTSVVNYAELLDQEIFGPLAPPQREALRSIATGAWHLAKLVEDMLRYVELGRESPLRWTEVDAARLAREAAAIVEPLARQRGLALRVSVPPDPVPLRSDPDRLLRVLLNLLSNALKFTPAGEMGLTLEEGEEWVRFRVWDTGIGIAEADLPRIWEPFWQVEDPLTRTVEGAGLGLGIVDRLVERLGGSRSVRSTPGEGSAFSVVLPRHPHVDE